MYIKTALLLCFTLHSYCQVLDQRVKLQFKYPTHGSTITNSYFLKTNFFEKLQGRKKDILYYYHLLPPMLFCGANTGLKNDKKFYEQNTLSSTFYDRKLTYQNVPNGYLRAASCTLDSFEQQMISGKAYQIEIVLFKSTTRDIIAFSLHGGSPLFIEFNQATLVWKEVTQEVFPELESFTSKPTGGGAPVFFKLPEIGLKIIATRDTQHRMILPDPQRFFKQQMKQNPQRIKSIEFNTQTGMFSLHKK